MDTSRDNLYYLFHFWQIPYNHNILMLKVLLGNRNWCSWIEKSINSVLCYNNSKDFTLLCFEMGEEV